ncbi:MAG: DUF420 domain-containing protein [Magnetococcales bacterium]|nr:DUF420 domain-containing protein [Magnetococcales bacterium]MBF0149463.1 DUF420 domain-containing protein [Magnetococcales bacterium]MBF0171874.1 DUF420 domain-containing protein [Magnetococcales bacterium]MBF0632274.1 DUF420 domain-containing protein [Magnetococcales bacterium]
MNHDTVALLPHLLAFLNLAGILFLVPAYLAIRSGRRDRHRRLMIGGLVVGVVFLVVYLVYHAVVGHVPFPGQGWMRVVYFSILATHVCMALVIAIMVPITVVWAIRGRFDKHVKIARWTLPIWLFVCVSGLVVYGMAISAAV